jgi:hypothetical protein
VFEDGVRLMPDCLDSELGAVVDAAPGIVTNADLPLRAFAGRFAG